MRLMKVYLIGTGPGDPELLSLKAERLIRMCDAVVYDDLIPVEILLLAKKGAKKIYVGKRGGKEYMKQPEINDLLVSLARQGLAIARLKGGDPCIFGRGGEEALFLRENGIPFEIIPGITSAIAGPESAGIPPTHRGMAPSVKFVTAHEDPAKESGFLDWQLLAQETGTIVFLMGAGRIEAVADRLISEGMDPGTPCALVQDATTPRQKQVGSTLREVAREAEKHRIGSPCIIIVGQVVRLGDKLFTAGNDQPLRGRSILITRPANLALGASRLFTSHGARAVVYPLVDIAGLDFELPDLRKYDMFIFTSQNAVPLFMEKAFSSGMDARAFSGSEILCIGPKTRDSLREYGIITDGMASEFRAEGIMDMLGSKDLSGKKICIPRSRDARPFLVDALRDRGAFVDEIPLYETVMPEDATREGFLQALTEVDTAVFTSPSGIRNASRLLGNELAALKVKKLVAIGPVTARAMEKLGLKPELVAGEYTDSGIIEALKGEQP
jgi:uroporphyrinogen III methyltransferase/synthase